MEFVEILGVRIACLDQAQLIEQALAWGEVGEQRTILYANAHSLNLAYEDPQFLQRLQRADLVYADGASLVWASRWLGGCTLHKLTGADWISPLASNASGCEVSIYMVGGRPGIADQAAINLRKRFPSLKIVGTSDGYFQAKSADQVIAEICETHPSIIFVGMGVRLQEEWIAMHQASTHACVWWGVGALFDFLAGTERRAPGWMNRSGFEWLWRLIMDPSGKWRRYLIGNPLFAYRVIRKSFQQDSRGS
jgi:N-acetylglucosaminyldiphosphoundecaprenol N-acetyl-beta-D-mannosaminyltransferase